MSHNAKKFIQNRGQDLVSITYSRIHYIMSYAIQCYQLLLADSPSYSKANVATTTSYHFEDYLKMEFVDGYLIKNKNLLAPKMLETKNNAHFTIKFKSANHFSDFLHSIY